VTSRLPRFAIPLFLVLPALAQPPADCLKITALIRADSDHYWAAWQSACRAPIASVYAVVTFLRQGVEQGSGLIGFHFVRGRGVTRYNTPAALGDYDHVRVRRIIGSLNDALRIVREID
jgi:hypothetical protein